MRIYERSYESAASKLFLYQLVSFLSFFLVCHTLREIEQKRGWHDGQTH